MLYPRPGESQESWESRVAKEEKRLLLEAGAKPETADWLSEYPSEKPSETEVSERARLALRNCGTGAGGFQPGNTCAKGSDEQSPANLQTKASSYLKGTGSGKGFLEQVRIEVAKAIDELHTIPSGAPNVSLKKSAGETTVGAFSPMENVIKVSAKGTHPLMTIAHEFGHYLDWKVFGTGASAATNGRGGDDEGIKNFLQAVESSKAYKQIDAIRKLDVSAAPYGINEDVVKSIRGWSHRAKYGSYLIQPRELWARAYAQYVAHRSSSVAMKKELQGEIDTAIRPQNPSVTIPWTRHWEPDDFEPIAKAIDDILASRGMKK